jgi:hypothetical protein
VELFARLRRHLASRFRRQGSPVRVLQAAKSCRYRTRARARSWGLMRTWALALFFAVSWAAQAHACVVGGWRLFFDDKSETTTTMSVATGKGCAINPRTSGGSTFSSVRISKQAKSGFAEIRDGNSPGYRSRPDFKGQDEFVATFCGEGAARKGCANLRVRVTVE